MTWKLLADAKTLLIQVGQSSLVLWGRDQYRQDERVGLAAGLIWCCIDSHSCHLGNPARLDSQVARGSRVCLSLRQDSPSGYSPPSSHFVAGEEEALALSDTYRSLMARAADDIDQSRTGWKKGTVRDAGAMEVASMNTALLADDMGTALLVLADDRNMAPRVVDMGHNPRGVGMDHGPRVDGMAPLVDGTGRSVPLSGDTKERMMMLQRNHSYRLAPDDHTHSRAAHVQAHSVVGSWQSSCDQSQSLAHLHRCQISTDLVAFDCLHA
jgi:hypothetical protein